MVKNPPAKQEMRVGSLGWENPLEKEMATHSSILALETPWIEEPGRLYSPWGHQRVGHDLVTKQQQQQQINVCECRKIISLSEGGLCGGCGYCCIQCFLSPLHCTSLWSLGAAQEIHGLIPGLQGLAV